jgi:hypothetical protein
MTAQLRGPVVGCALFALYAVTTGHSVGWEDSAFFQLCHATLGVPHGPGFPLYVLLGHLWVIPFGAVSAWGSNLLSGFAMALAGVVLLEVILQLLVTSGACDRKQAAGPWAVAGAISVILGWGTLEVVWREAVRTEVYALTLLLVLTTILLALKAQDVHKTKPPEAARLTVAAAWVWGLALAVHPLIAVASATPWLSAALIRLRTQPRALTVALLGAALPLSLYLYPYLRGQIDGVWAWGSFANWQSSLDYYLRRSAWATVVNVDGGFRENLGGWVHALPRMWPAGLWLPVLFSWIWLKREAALAGSLLGTALLVLWAAPFDPHNLDLLAYFLPFIALLTVSVGIFVVKAVLFLQAQMPALGSQSRLALGFFTFSLLLGWPTAAVISARETPTPAAGAGELVNALVLSLPRGATVLAAEDNLLGVMTYAQRVQGLRPDINVIAPGALRYPFYRAQVRAHMPKSRPTHWLSLEVWDSDEWNTRVREWIAQRPTEERLFTQYDAIPGLDPRLLSPAGYLYAVSSEPTQIPWAQAAEFWRTAPKFALHDPLARAVMTRWTFNFGSFAIQRGNDVIGWDALRAAVHMTPEDPEIYYLLGNAFGRAGRAGDARAMYAAAVELAPYRQRYREALSRYAPELAEKR